jgi:festuclavine dehydrogenase
MPSAIVTVLLLGGTGKVASRIVPLLSDANYYVLQASRSGKSDASYPNCSGVKFDWFDESTYALPFSGSKVDAVFIVSPPIIDSLAPTRKFVDIARDKGVSRFVLLSASILEVGDGPAMSQASKYISELGVDYAILRPSWFMGTSDFTWFNLYNITMYCFGQQLGMICCRVHANIKSENFSEQQHRATIRDSSQIITAAGDGKVPFVSADDIAHVALRALTDEKSHNTDHLILGPELFTYDEVRLPPNPLFFTMIVLLTSLSRLQNSSHRNSAAPSHM